MKRHWCVAKNSKQEKARLAFAYKRTYIIKHNEFIRKKNNHFLSFVVLQLFDLEF